MCNLEFSHISVNQQYGRIEHVTKVELTDALYHSNKNKKESFKSVPYEEFKCKNRYINFYQFEIFTIKAVEKQRT